MSFVFKRALLLGSSTVIALGCCNGTAMSQSAAPTELPAINVTAPSPIVRRKPAPPRAPSRVARAVPARTAGPAPADTAAAPAPQQGLLPIVTDQFATVTVVPS